MNSKDCNEYWDKYQKKSLKALKQEHKEAIDKKNLYLKRIKNIDKNIQETNTFKYKLLNTIKIAREAGLLAISLNKVQLNRNTATALETRGLSHIAGLCYISSGLQHGSNRNISLYWDCWCDASFLDFQKRVSKKGVTSYEFYKFLETLKDVQSEYEIKQEIAMFTLKHL